MQSRKLHREEWREREWETVRWRQEKGGMGLLLFLVKLSHHCCYSLHHFDLWLNPCCSIQRAWNHCVWWPRVRGNPSQPMKRVPRLITEMFSGAWGTSTSIQTVSSLERPSVGLSLCKEREREVCGAREPPLPLPHLPAIFSVGCRGLAVRFFTCRLLTELVFRVIP